MIEVIIALVIAVICLAVAYYCYSSYVENCADELLNKRRHNKIAKYFMFRNALDSFGIKYLIVPNLENSENVEDVQVIPRFSNMVDVEESIKTGGIELFEDENVQIFMMDISDVDRYMIWVYDNDYDIIYNYVCTDKIEDVMNACNGLNAENEKWGRYIG